MDRTSVSSSNVAEIGYDAALMTLEVLFHNGTTYQYFDVPEAVYQDFIGSDSKGTFLNTHIKNNYRYSKV